MANKVFIAASLDGYIATADNGLGWLNDIPNPNDDDFGFSEFMDSIDALVMGRQTYEVVLSFGQWVYTKPVFVLSRSLSQIDDNMKDKAEIISGELAAVSTRLGARGFKNLYIDGGKVIQGFLAEDLVDEITITRFPIILGGGIPLFGALDNPVKLDHRGTIAYDNGLVKSSYAVVRKAE